MRASSLVLVALLPLLALGAAPAIANHHEANEPTTQSGRGSDESRPLTATFEPTPAPENQVYSGRYFFAMTRGVADSALHPAVQAPLFLLTVPIDIALVPMALVAGFF